MPVWSKYSALHLVPIHSGVVVVLYIGLSIVISFGSCLCLHLQAGVWHWTGTLDLSNESIKLLSVYLKMEAEPAAETLCC
jgi:hypothetical protein